jgi:two-component system CheB/CheR fusion protein
VGTDKRPELAGAQAEVAPSQPFPVAAIGASAGGLNPTIEVLRELGPDPGLALVVVHHLDPSHASELVPILARTTAIPVESAATGTRIERNHVYVVPPNADLRIANGVLELVPRVDDSGLHLPIDRFLEALAVDRTSLAVGVVLSGSGFDGSEGIKVIKREGGITFAQDASAQYASMPQSAISTGCVDFILPPEAIARELVHIGQNPPALMESTTPEVDEPDYQRILALVRKAGGVDFASYKHSTLRRRVQRRVFLRRTTTLADYLELLKREPAEVNALCEELLIHVTGFFREPESFEALKRLVFPKLLEDRPGDAPLRIWVPGCSTGEEVYSIAMCLLEYLDDTRRSDMPLKVFGTDLSLATVEKARAGRYGESIERDVSEGRLSRFFTKESGVYQIRRDVRDMCVFAKHDVTRDPPFSAMDLISCRNLMIYLGPVLQDRVVALLHFALKEPGFLVLGSSETVRSFPGFATIDGRNKIYQRTSAAPRLLFDFATPRVGYESGTQAPGAPITTSTRGSSATDIQREADRLVLAEFAPPGVVVTDDLAILQFRGQTGTFLEPAPGVASLDLLRMARDGLKLPLRRAFDVARAKRSAVRERGVDFVAGDDMRRTVDLQIIPFTVHSARQTFFLVLFEDVTPGPGAIAAPDEAARAERPSKPDEQSAEAQLRQDLDSTRQYLESVIEQLEASNEELKAANEEIVSSNEELRSTNEELQSAKEELQATNEELGTVNDEMRDRNVEAHRLNDDLTNVLSSVEIPIVILGRDTRIRRFTPAASKLFSLASTDLGRPVGDLAAIPKIAPLLPRLVPQVLEELRPAECSARDTQDRWYQVSVRPYVTLDGRIDGTVIAAFDIDAVKRGAERLADARNYAEAIVDTVREGLVVLDEELRIRSTNRCFQELFELRAKDCEGRHLEDLGRKELAGPAMSAFIENVRAGANIDRFRLRHEDPKGDRVFLLSTRQVAGTPLVLLAFEDITENERAARAVEAAELDLRDILLHATEAILMIGANGEIVFVNHAAAAMFGYEPTELIGLAIDTLLPDTKGELHASLHERLTAPTPRSVAADRATTGRRKDGTELPIEVVLSPATRETGPRVVAFVTDMTERRKAEKAIADYEDKLHRMAFDAALSEERERRRIAVELHDRIGQALARAQLKLAAVRDGIAGKPRTAVDETIDLLAQSAVETRSLTFELSPPVLYDLGLKEALAWLAEDIEKRQGIHVELTDDDASLPLDDATRAIVFRSVRELLMNVFKHAHAPSAKVSLRRTEEGFEIAVEDRGVGFDAREPSDPKDKGFGLLSVREQLRRLGGTLEVISEPTKGTRVNLRLPLTSASSTAQGDT